MRIFFLYVFSFFLLDFLLSSCTFSLPKDLVPLIHTDQCPEWTLSQLEKNASLFNHNTDIFTLECSLNLLRRSKNKQIYETSSGSHICFLLADRIEKDPIRRERFASEGVRWAEIALAGKDKADGDVYYYLAVNLGIAVKEHAALAVKNIGRLVSSLEKAIELSPDVNYAGPYRVLGMIYLLAPPWPQGIGDGDRALELLHEAVEKHPEHPKNQIFYARALWEIEGEANKKETAKHIEEALRLINQEQWKSAKERWIKDLIYVAKEADIELPSHDEIE